MRLELSSQRLRAKLNHCTRKRMYRRSRRPLPGMLARIPMTPGDLLVSHTFTVAQSFVEAAWAPAGTSIATTRAGRASHRCRGRGIALMLANSGSGCATL